MNYREANLDDIVAIRYLAHQTWSQAYRNIIPEQVQTAFLNSAYSDQMLIERIKRGFVYIALDCNSPIGFINFSILQHNEVELLALYVLPENQRRGVGSRLLKIMLGHIKYNEIILCNVETDNKIGIAFYKKKGFIEEQTYQEIFLATG